MRAHIVGLVCEELVFRWRALLNMESDKQHARHSLLFYSRRAKKNVQTKNKLTEREREREREYEESVLTMLLCQNWFPKFRFGNFNIENAMKMFGKAG